MWSWGRGDASAGREGLPSKPSDLSLILRISVVVERQTQLSSASHMYAVACMPTYNKIKEVQRVHVAYTYMKNYAKSIATRDIQVKTPQKFHLAQLERLS